MYYIWQLTPGGYLLHFPCYTYCKVEKGSIVLKRRRIYERWQNMKQNKQKSKRLDHECHPGPLKLPELPLLFLRIETKYSFLCCSKIVHQAFSYDCIFTAGNYLSLTALLGMKMKNIIGNVFYLYYHYCLTPFFCFNFRVKHLIYSHSQ